MVQTPWGDSETLRERRLSPGAATPRREVLANQRERLFGALVACVADKGYEATRVEDLIELSGVSRKAFYEHFGDKRECLLAAVEALVEPTIARIAETGEQPAGMAGTREAFDAFVDLLVEQSAAARMCFVEIYAAGPDAVGAIERATESFEVFVSQTLAQVPGREEMPPGLVRAMIGGLQKVIQTRLRRGEEAELVGLVPQLWEWGLSYLPPPAPLRRPRRRAAHPAAGPAGAAPTERILRATAAVVGERGYPEATVGEIAKRAPVSLRTFYGHFADKEEAMLAAVDRGSALMLAATLPAFRRAHDWAASVRSAFEAMLNFAAEEPVYARLGAVGVYGAGKRALDQRDEIMEGMQGLLEPGYELAPQTPRIAAEAIGGAVYSLIYEEVRKRGPERLPELAPLATYVALCPFLGAEEACEAANGDGRRR